MMFVDGFYDQLMLSIEIERDWIKNSLKLVESYNELILANSL